MNVTQLWRYPVKSMIGETVDSLRVEALGVVGDRTWAVRDLERGGIRGAKKIGALMKFAALDLGDGDVEITTLAGDTLRTSDSEVDSRLSAELGRAVRLERLRPAHVTDHYRRGAPDNDDIMAEFMDIFGRIEGEPLPDLSVFPPELAEYESPPGTYYDAFPLMVMTEQALAGLAADVPDSAIDVRRFRPSLVIDAPDQRATVPGHPEFDWVGRSARLGSAVIEFGAACPRCVMITREIDGSLPVDRAILRHVVRELNQNVGVYATVATPGEVRFGDELSLL